MPLGVNKIKEIKYKSTIPTAMAKTMINFIDELRLPIISEFFPTNNFSFHELLITSI